MRSNKKIVSPNDYNPTIGMCKSTRSDSAPVGIPSFYF